MDKEESLYKKMKAGLLLTSITGVVLIAISIFFGRENVFLLLNGDGGKFGDNFFTIWTSFGEALSWIILAVLFYVYQKDKFILYFASLILSTILTQFIKHILFENLKRPTAAISDLSRIHTVTGVELHTANSFPSGHTATAFTIFLLGCLLIKNKCFIPVGFIAALLVGYSRIYLAQHFPIDVGGGMLVSVITVLLSFWIQNKWGRK